MSECKTSWMHCLQGQGDTLRNGICLTSESCHCCVTRLGMLVCYSYYLNAMCNFRKGVGWRGGQILGNLVPRSQTAQAKRAKFFPQPVHSYYYCCSHLSVAKMKEFMLKLGIDLCCPVKMFLKKRSIHFWF